MAFVVAARWTALPGHEREILDAVRSMVEPSRLERQCLAYIPHINATNPRELFIYEQYVDETGYQSHRESEHFLRYAAGYAFERLEDRSIGVYRTLEWGEGAGGL